MLLNRRFIKPIGGLGTGMRVGWGLYFKNTHDYRSRIFNKAVNIINAKSWGLQDRYGTGMNGSKRPIKSKSSRWGWGLFRRLNSPPKIENLFSMIYLWSWIWIEGRDKYSLNKLTPFILKWFKYQSFLTHLKRGIIKWSIRTDYMNCVCQSENLKKMSVNI